MVEVQATPLPVNNNDVRVDLGLTILAGLSTGEIVENPRHLRRKARALALSQKSLARKRVGSNNRKKAAARVAVLRRKVRETRATQRAIALSAVNVARSPQRGGLHAIAPR